jgi:lysophospholipase L1-like esterase
LRRLVTAVVAAAMCMVATAATAGCSGSPAGTRARTTADRSPRVARSGPVRPARPHYYLSLGDSLAVGVQPDSAGASLPTDDGYADHLFALLRPRTPKLRLVKLGCSGETSFTLIHGGICHYPAGSQLTEAVRFLHAHRRQVSLVTIDIGANDPNSCFLGAPLSKLASCMNSRVRLTVADLRTIMSKLRAAGGRRIRVIGMNYYVPELSGWFHGKGGQELSVLLERLVGGYNSLLSHVYHRYRARVANVFAAFHSSDFTDRVTLPQIGTIPRNVATVCQLTWACSTAPQGPNEHANAIGYAIIALAFLAADHR